jgi:hypothetical protein
MHCYACLVETGYTDQPACALCQHCGGGMCRRHLVELPTRAVYGPAGSPDSRLLCQRCYCALVAPAGPSKPREAEEWQSARRLWPQWKWWQRLWHRRKSPGLPSAEEAIAAAEQFLKRKQHR